jgi:hypothetical protein
MVWMAENELDYEMASSLGKKFEDTSLLFEWPIVVGRRYIVHTRYLGKPTNNTLGEPIWFSREKAY